MKVAARRSQNCIITRGYLSRYRRNSVTKLLSTAAELWPKTIFNMAAVRHFEF